MKTFLIVLGSIFGLLLLGIIGFILWIGVSMEAGSMPDTMVKRGRELKPATVLAIEKLVPLRPGEKIEYFYSAGFWSFEEDGNIITSQRVISYSTDNDVFWSDEADLDDIESIEPEFSETWLEDTFVWINPTDGEGFCIFLSCEEKIDREAVNYLRDRGITIGPIDEEAEEMESEEPGGEETDESVPDDSPPSEDSPTEGIPDDEPTGDEVPAAEEVEEPALP